LNGSNIIFQKLDPVIRDQLLARGPDLIKEADSISEMLKKGISLTVLKVMFIATPSSETSASDTKDCFSFKLHLIRSDGLFYFLVLE
jgi:hypothetical protein